MSTSVSLNLSLEAVLEMIQWCYNSVVSVHDLKEISVEYELCRT